MKNKSVINTVGVTELAERVAEKLQSSGMNINSTTVELIIKYYELEAKSVLVSGDYITNTLGSFRAKGRNVSKTVVESAKPTAVGEWYLDSSIKSEVRTKMNSDPEFFDKVMQ